MSLPGAIAIGVGVVGLTGTAVALRRAWPLALAVVWSVTIWGFHRL